MKWMVPIRAAGLAGLLTLVALSGARAQDASAWQKDRHSSMRLLAGSRSGGAAVLGGMAFQLDPGWHTYWRDPGDSGVPPRFDFSRSDNVESVTVLWPAPQQFDDGAGGRSLGYQTRLLLPLRVVAKRPDQPLTLRATVNYAVCEKLCVPVEASAELAFTSAVSSVDGALKAALDTVPKPAKVGDAHPLAIREVRRDGKTVIVDVTAPAGSEITLLAEGPTPEWALPVPKQVSSNSAEARRFTFDLLGLPPGATAKGAALKFTLLGADQAYEYDVNLQ